MSIAKTELFVVTTNIKSDDELIAHQKFLRTFPDTHEIGVFIVKRTELHVVRPILEEIDGKMVRWDRIPSNDLDVVAFVYHELAKEGLRPIAQSPKMTLVAPVTKEERAQLVTDIIPPSVLKQNVHEALRLPIYLKVAPREEAFQAMLPEATFENDELDGLVAIWDGPTLQVRVRGRDKDGKSVWQKGLLMHSLDGTYARAKWAEFGKELPREVEVYVIADYREMSANQNMLAVLAGMEDPEQYIRVENEKLAEANLNQFLDHRVQELVAYGAPIGALLRVPQLYNLVERFPVDRKRGGTFVVLPDYTGRVPFGKFALGEGSQFKPREQYQTVQRNPVMFRGGIAPMQFWGYIPTGEPFAVYLNPDDPMLEFYAADFDGDMILVKDQEEHESYRAPLGHKTKYLVKPEALKTNNFDALLASMVASPFTKTGTITLGGMRLRAMEAMTDELAVLGSDLTQGCTHAAKKAVNKDAHAKDLGAFQESVFEAMPEGGCVIDKTNAVRREVALETKKEAFQSLCEHTPNTTTELEVVKRAHIVRMHAKAVEALSSWDKAWPAAVKERADAELFEALQEERLTQDMIDAVRKAADEYRTLAAQPAEDDDERQEKKRAFSFIRETVELGVAMGWPQGLLIKYLPPSLSVDFIDMEWLKGVGIHQRFSYLQVEETLEDGEYDPSEIVTADARYPNFSAGATFVEIRRVEDEGELCVARAVIPDNIDVVIDEEEEFLCG